MKERGAELWLPQVAHNHNGCPQSIDKSPTNATERVLPRILKPAVSVVKLQPCTKAEIFLSVIATNTNG
ncbi:hypothetical protein GOP47_0013455 [Adiantum capillus-veneris]|uniref:Uncharacterized protein n=1 Tax=Adiantum capillus-veneris TaxID=13818 RepID=A0A9D4UP38_ADICA|nr:hypothetical protein GOP47_0013455 [Adiantum capillus-veneris]